MDSKNTSLILFSAVFLLLGFLLGRVTAPQPHGPHALTKGPLTCDPSGLAEEFTWVSEDGEDMQVTVISEGDFEGDTVFALPGGGTVNVVRNGDEMEVEVEAMAGSMTGSESREESQVTVTRSQGVDGEVRIEKRVIVIQEEN